MRKLIIGSRFKVKDVESYVNAVRGLKFRHLPAYKNLPEELLSDDSLVVSTALREANYNGPIVTKDALEFINKNLDNDKYIVYGHGEISLAEWLALTNEHVSLIYSRGSCDYIAVSNELLSLNCPEKWKPLCQSFTCGADKYELPSKINVIKDVHNLDSYTAILPMMGINSKQVASTIIARDTASMLAKGNPFSLKYVFILDDRNSLGISLDEPADALNKVGSFIFGLTTDMCGNKPINESRNYELKCKPYKTKTIGNNHLLIGTFVLKIGEASCNTKDRPIWGDLPDMLTVIAGTPASSGRISSATPNVSPIPREYGLFSEVSEGNSMARLTSFLEGLSRVMNQSSPSSNVSISEVQQALRQGMASLSDDVRLLPGSLRLSRRLDSLLLRMQQQGNPMITRQYILTCYTTLDTILHEADPEILRQEGWSEAEDQIWNRIVRLL